MRYKRVGVGGSAANPIHWGHLIMLEAVMKSGLFDEVFWIPSGIRKDKSGLSSVNFEHRMVMILRAFSSPELRERNMRLAENPPLILWDDVCGRNTPTVKWFEKLRKKFRSAEIIWYTGSDSVAPQKKFGGRCEIEALWVEGEKLMKDYKFLIIPRPGYVHPKNLALPPQFEILKARLPKISSSDIREKIAAGKKFEHLVPRSVAEYIKENNLYGWKGGKLNE